MFPKRSNKSPPGNGKQEKNSSKKRRSWRSRAALGIGSTAVAGALLFGGYKLAPGYRTVKFMKSPPIELVRTIKKAKVIPPEVIASAVSQGGKLTPGMEERLQSLLRARMPAFQVRQAMAALKTPQGQGAGLYLLCKGAHQEALKNNYVYWDRNEYVGPGAQGFERIQHTSQLTVIIYGALHGRIIVDEKGIVQTNRMREDPFVLGILSKTLEMEGRLSEEELAAQIK